MPKPLIVSGIGTDVGKTYVSACLCLAFDLDYWKPIQTGCKDHTQSDSTFVRNLTDTAKTTVHPERYLFSAPQSPHHAAHLENTVIDIEQIKIPQTSKPLLIEGAGGLLVPLNDRFLLADLIQRLEGDLILVVRNYLGCINHTLLSIEYALQRGLNLQGLILNGDFPQQTIEALIAHGKVPILALIAENKNISPNSMAAAAAHLKKDLSWIFGNSTKN